MSMEDLSRRIRPELARASPYRWQEGIPDPPVDRFDMNTPAEGPAWMLRFVLRGPCPAAPALQSDELIEQACGELTESLGALCVEIDSDGVWRPLDYAPYQNQPHLLGIALGVAGELAKGDDELLLRLSPDELSGCTDPEAKRAYLRTLLADAEHSVAEALLREDMR